MYILINLLILCVVVFLYIHIYYHIKTSNYLEIYEIDNVSKEKLEELCGLKQPILLNNIDLNINLDISSMLLNYKSFDLKILNRQESDNNYIPIKLDDAYNLFARDISYIYISENNNDFLEETSLVKEIHNKDIFLRPYNVSEINYDIIMGSINSYTKLKYNLNCRNYFSLQSGSVEFTLCPPKSYKYLYIDKDYENLEFNSRIDIYNTQDIYKNDFEKVKLLRVILKPNQILQIPAYWLYSIQILEKNTLLTKLSYRSYMNSLSVMPYIFMKFLQNNNIKSNLTKLVDTY